ncbi:MAG: acyl carrier protein [Acidiferrobacteraceae bacterium]
MRIPATVHEDVLAVVRQYGQLPTDPPLDRDLYAELHVESINAISILLGLEEKFSVTIEDRQFALARTARQLIDLIEHLLGASCKQLA